MPTAKKTNQKPKTTPKQPKTEPQTKTGVQFTVNKEGGFQRADDFKQIYVNSTQFGFTRWDFQIMFGTISSARDPAYKHGKEVATVIMTPIYAKALLQDYIKVLAEFEAKYGKIEIGVDFTQAIIKEQEAGDKKK